MGVGYPDDLLEAVARGCDLFDCVALRHETRATGPPGRVRKAR